MENDINLQVPCRGGGNTLFIIWYSGPAVWLMREGSRTKTNVRADKRILRFDVIVFWDVCNPWEPV